MPRIQYVFHATALLIVAGIAPSLAAAPPAGNMPTPVRMEKVLAATVTDSVAGVGTLLAGESVLIRPEIAGRIAAFHFEEGQRVARGARLVSLDDAILRAQLAQAQAAAQLAQRKLERARDLAARNFLSQQALDEARENASQAQARLREDEARLDKTVIRAPFAGVIGLRLSSPGAYVKEGEDIARLEKIDTLKLDVAVPEVYFPKIRVGQKLTVMVDAWPGEIFQGEVYAMAPFVDRDTRTIRVRARVANAAARLRPGMFARVTAPLPPRIALTIPEQAVVPKGGKLLVFKVSDGHANPVPVQIGARRDGRAEVVSGLAAGDTVVVEGQMKLKPGAAVVPVEVALQMMSKQK